MKIRRFAPALAAAAAMAISLSGCGEPEDGGTGQETGGSQAETTTITLLSWTREPQMTPQLEAFAAAHPEVKIDVTYSPPVDEYIQTLQTRILSGTAPDVFIITAENKTNLIEGQYVLDLAGEPFMQKVPEYNRRALGKDGAEYGLSVASWAGGLLYNEDLLAGVGYEAMPESWDDFLEMGKKLKETGVAPYLQAGAGLNDTLIALLGARDQQEDHQMDAKIFAGESTFAAEYTPVLEGYNRLVTEGIMSPDVVGLDSEQLLTEFSAGRVAMIPAGPWNITPIAEANPELNFKFALVPALAGTEPYASGCYSAGYAINVASDAKQQAAAKVFLEWLTTPEAAAIINQETGDATVLPGYEPAVPPQYEPMVPSIQAGEIYLPQASWSRSEDVLATEFSAQLQRMIQGEITPKQVAEALDAKLAAAG
ncbi:MAG: extracellular solute-binding protein [Bifidobacteriaceae bacterium]|jgi:ABC-type glycerol-3-phosphate transport system substrate-binding protein|nr:extracellular solute-binding protein [Bifidobacteriaceae bacterium]